MRVIFMLKESIYDCKLQITDSEGTRCFLISALSDNQIAEQCITVDIFGSEFDLAVIPLVTDYKQMLGEIEEEGFTDKLAKKATGFIFSTMKKALLRVGCNYHIQGLQDGDRLDIYLQAYAFGTFDRFDLLGLIPMMYVFFEVSHFTSRFAPIAAYETNRKEVVKSAKALAFAQTLGDGFFIAVFTYPIQVGRIKRLSKNKKIFKVLSRFHNMSEDERQRLLEKREKFL